MAARWSRELLETNFEEGSSEDHTLNREEKEKETQFSLLEMDLCGESMLSYPLIPLPQKSMEKKDQLENPPNKNQTLGNKEMYELLSAENKRHQEELKSRLDKNTEDMVGVNIAQLKELENKMDKQFQYIHNQFTSTINWRLKQYHAELLNNLKAVLTPMASAIQGLEEEVTNCAGTIHALSGEVSSIRNFPTSLHPPLLVNTAVQTLPVTQPSFNQHVQTARQRLQSTLCPGGTEEEFISPVHFEVHNEPKATYRGKSPIEMHFPMFGRMEDTTDPLLFLEKCKDYLALHPLSDAEIIATLRNVLHGTARDWWDVARLEIHTWMEFAERFRSAFLSEDYQDELAERVRTCIQGENESIRDFAYKYRSLCKRWNPKITEPEVVKLTLKNINPKLASQLRSSNIATVEALVRLGQQLEKDRENQRQYEQKHKLMQKPPKPDPAPQLTQSNSPGVSSLLLAL